MWKNGVRLPYNDEKFGTLPPHFVPDVMAQMDVQFWTTIVPGYLNYPTGMKCALPHLLASIIYHESFLKGNFNVKHPIFNSRIFTNNPLLSVLRSSIVLGIGKCDKSGMQATGIPTHLAIAAKLNKLSNEIDQMRLNNKLFEEKIMTFLPDIVATKVVDVLHSEFTIDGAAPVSTRDINELRNEINGMKVLFCSKMDSLQNNLCNRECGN